jgi:Spy/CpxP family protein refolding chaperone
MKRIMLVTCLIGLMAAVGARAADETSTSTTGEHHSARGGMDSLLPPRLLEKLALTGEQKTKYDTLNASFKKDLAKLEGSSTSSTNSASSSGNTGRSNRKGIRELRKNYMDQFRPSLTSEQTATLDKAAEEMRNRRSSQGGTNSAAKPSTPPSDN